MNNSVNQKARLLFIAPLPPPFAGPEISTQTLLEGGLKQYFNFTLIKSNIRLSNAEKGKFDFKGLIRFLSVIRKLFAKVILKRPDVVYLIFAQNKVGFFRDTIYVFSAKIFSCKIIAHLRGGNFKNFYDSLPGILQFVAAGAVKQFNHLIVQSESIANQFTPFVDRGRISLLPNCVNTELIACAGPVIKNDTKVVLYVGHLSYAKGYYDLVDVIPEIAAIFPLAEFWFLGEEIKKERNIILTENQERINRVNAIKQRFAKNIKYLGIVENRRIFSIMKSSKMLVLPSYSEGFPMVILEAMACGLPVVTTRVGALPDIVHDGINGYLIEPGDTKNLRERVISLLQNEQLCKKIGEENARYVENNFQPQHVIAQFSKIVEKVISNHA